MNWFSKVPKFKLYWKRCGNAYSILIFIYFQKAFKAITQNMEYFFICLSNNIQHFYFKCKLESENNIAIDYYRVSIRLINLFNLVHIHLIKIGSIKYTKWEVKQQVLWQQEAALVSSFCIDRFDSGCFRMSYEFVSTSALRTILSVSSHNHILKFLEDCAGSRYSKSNFDSDILK